jgi:hypothetical protein
MYPPQGDRLTAAPAVPAGRLLEREAVQAAGTGHGRCRQVPSQLPDRLRLADMSKGDPP